MTEPAHPLLNPSAKKLALLGQRLRATPGQCFLSEPVAVLGVGCRFPGAAGPAQFWQMLLEGRDAVTEVPPGRWDVGAWCDPDPQAPGKSYSRWGGFLDRVDEFDAAFFGVSPREARHMDPRQRLLLEVAWEALGSAGLDPAKLSGSSTGVFVGHMVGDYYALELAHLAGIDSYSSTGNLDAILANRLSYVLDLQGPSLAVDTACSSSLVALYLACQGLRQDECQLALAGGVNLMLAPQMHVMGARSLLLSPAGRCKTFDRGADGFVRGEGCGLLVLKRLADALAAGDPVLAVIRGIAVNQDGRTNGISAPNGLSQQRVIRRALDNALLGPEKVTFVETHGTGTLVGDIIEVEALAEVYGGPSPEGPCYLGAVKTNVGHLEAAAGAAGVVKMVLCLLHGRIPPNLHLHEVNPHLPLASSRFRFPREAVPWSVSEGPRRGAVSSFGLGGTNAHVILEEAPPGSAPKLPLAQVAPVFRRQSYWLVPRAAGPVKPFADLLYRLDWRPAPLGTGQPHEGPGPWLIVARGGELATALVERLGRAGQGARMAPEHQPPAAGPYRGIVYLAGGREESDAPAAAEAECCALLRLVQTLARSAGTPRLWLVTQGSQAVTGAEPILPAGAALWGLARTVRLEHPELRCVSIDLAPDGADLEALVAELLAPGESQVAHRGGARYVARLVRHGGEAAAAALRDTGCYLITGGLGALGLEVARCLVENGARQLVLAGRRGRTEGAALDELRGRGAVVLVVSADVARPDDVARLLAACASCGPLRGIVHAAGVLDDGVLENLTAERMVGVMAPKVCGAWELHRQTEALPLDFFVSFSSLASLLGSPGQGNYAAANAFLDGLAHHRRARGLPALSINWGPWAQAGMAARLHDRLQAHGESMIDPALGARLFLYALAQGVAQLGAMRVDWARYAATYPAPELLGLLREQSNGTRPAAAPGPTLLERLLTTPTELRRELIEDFVQSQVGAVLGHPARSVPRTQGFAHLGMDSLAALELRTRLERALDCRLPTTLAFDYPDVATLAAHLLEVQSGRLHEPRPAPGADLPGDAALEGLSREEIAALLARELGSPEEGNPP
jgi:acyl transferase domain-containing protein/acyl carrier protein